MTAAQEDAFADLIHRKGYKAFAPRRPGLSQQDVDQMTAAHNPAGDVAPGDVDHVEYAAVADELDICHLGVATMWQYYVRLANVFDEDDEPSC